MSDIFTRMTDEQSEELARNPFRAVESFYYGVYAIRPLDRDMGMDIEQTEEESEQVKQVIDKINLAVKELEDLGFFIGSVMSTDGVGHLMGVPEKVEILSSAMEFAFRGKGGDN